MSTLCCACVSGIYVLLIDMYFVGFFWFVYNNFRRRYIFRRDIVFVAKLKSVSTMDRKMMSWLVWMKRFDNFQHLHSILNNFEYIS